MESDFPLFNCSTKVLQLTWGGGGVDDKENVARQPVVLLLFSCCFSSSCSSPPLLVLLSSALQLSMTIGRQWRRFATRKHLPLGTWPLAARVSTLRPVQFNFNFNRKNIRTACLSARLSVCPPVCLSVCPTRLATRK